MFKSSIIILSLVVMVSCSSKKDSWSEKDRNDFMSACVVKAETGLGEKAKSYCDCMLKKIEKKYPDVNEVQNKLTMAETFAMAKDCQ